MKVDIENAKNRLRYHKLYGYGDLVGDPRAFAMRLMRVKDWTYMPSGRLAKSTLEMLCPKCSKPPLVLEADVQP